ncbi:zinc ABC transporter substrate-binding protein [Alphaproteobacteria bacterium]|nr:zinc ABC transporter substrate-binding protein [Alphaproteobacteria bacterium]
MNKLFTIITLLFISNTSVFASETKGVITTIQPINALVNAVIGNTGGSTSLIPSEVSPHEFKLKPSDVKSLQNGNIIFYISSHLESSITKVFKNLPKNIKIVNLMEETGVNHLAIRDNEEWERHDHHDDHDKHAKKYDHHDDHDKHAKKDDHHDDHEKEDDVHIWLDPDNAIKIIQKVNKELSLLFPENSQIYNKNATDIINKITELKREIKEELLSIKDKPYIVFHDAYQYFEKVFGLNAVGSIALEDDVATSPKQISYIRNKIIKSNVSCVFQEPQFDSKLVKTVVEGTDAKIGTLDPLGVDIANKKDFYLQLIRNMSKSLKECLG